jgi:hypothetical protein
MMTEIVFGDARMRDPFLAHFSPRWKGNLPEKAKQVCAGIPVKYMLVLKRNALPCLSGMSVIQMTHCPITASALCARHRAVFGGWQWGFFKLLCLKRFPLEGRRKPVIWLQRHPLIYPIFLSHFSVK